MARQKNNPKASEVFLPPCSQGVSQQADPYGTLVNVYADAIEFVGARWHEGSLPCWLGTCLRCVCVMWLAGAVAAYGMREASPLLLAGIASIIALGAVWWVDRSGFLYLPVIFDRAHRKVHVFRDVSGSVLWWRAKAAVETFDWEMFDTFLTHTGPWDDEDAGWWLRHSALRLMAAPRMHWQQWITVRPSVLLGFCPYGEACNTMFARWEYVRRYMQHEIEAVPGEVADGVLASAWDLGDLDNAGLGVVDQMIQMGPMRFASCRGRARPEWPAGILATLGEPVSRERLQAGWRDERAAV